MSDRVHGTPPPKPPTEASAPKTSQIPFANVMDFLEIMSQIDSLQKVMLVAKQAQHAEVDQQRQGAAPAKADVQESDDPLWKQTKTAHDNGKTLFPTLRDLDKALADKNAPQAAKDLEKLCKLYLSFRGAITPEMQEALEETLSPLLSQSGDSGDLAEQMLSASLGKSQLSPEEELELLDHLSNMAPPSPFSEAAKKLAANLRAGQSLTSPEEADKESQALLAKKGQPLEKASVNAYQAECEKTDLTPSLVSTHTLAVLNATTQDVTKEDIKIELEYLKKLLALLGKKLPGNATVAQFEAMLATIAKHYPNLSQGDIQQLNKLIGSLLPFIKKMKSEKKLSADDEIAALEDLNGMFKKIAAHNKGAIAGWQNDITQKRAQEALSQAITQKLNLIYKLMGQIFEGGANFPGGGLDDIAKLMANVHDLMKDYSSMSPDQKKLADKLFNALDKFHREADGYNTVDGNLAKFLATLQTEKWMQDYVKQCQADGTKPTVAGAKAYIQKQLAALPQSGNAYFQDFQTDVKGFLSDPNFPNVHGAIVPSLSGTNYPTLGKEVNGELVLDPNYFYTIESTFTTSGPLDPTLKAIQQGAADFTTDANKDAAAINADQAAIAQFQAVNAAIAKAQTKVQDALLASQALPIGFANTIINHYMPGQEKYLMQLAELLFFSNFGTEMDNTLLNDLMGWGDSANNYGLNNWLASNKTNGDYRGSVASAKGQINDEKNQVNSDINKAKKALNDIEKKLAEIKKLEKEGKLSKTQAGKLEKQLNNVKGQLQTAVKNLTKLGANLDKILKDIKATPNGFSIPQSDVDALRTDENLVVKGDPKNGNYGGLVNIETQLTNDQTGWSGMSQKNQINLQMHMTEIQQEWTVVSTSLQLLNQMYMTLAQAIYK